MIRYTEEDQDEIRIEDLVKHTFPVFHEVFLFVNAVSLFLYQLAGVIFTADKILSCGFFAAIIIQGLKWIRNALYVKGIEISVSIRDKYNCYEVG